METSGAGWLWVRGWRVERRASILGGGEKEGEEWCGVGVLGSGWRLTEGIHRLHNNFGVTQGLARGSARAGLGALGPLRGCG